MESVVCVMMGYFMGALNPAAMLAKRKQVNLREQGTKNLGASNVTVVMGKKYGAIVMLIDIFKAYIAAKVAKWMFPKYVLAQLLAGGGAIVGHVYPFHLKFKGGKGLAAFGGMVLAFDPWMFLGLLVLGLVLMFTVNQSYILPISAGFLFPVLAGLKSRNLAVFLVAAGFSALMVIKHWSNIGKAKRGEENKMRDTFKDLFSNKKDKD